MIKRILVPLDPSPFTETALKFATTIARINKAELTGLVILDLPGIEKSVGAVPLGGLYYADQISKAKEREAEERIKLLLDKFEKKCKAENVAYRSSELQGSPSERILQESIYYDAVIMGLKTYFHFETEDKPGDSMTKLMQETITPVYGVPEKFNLPGIPDEKIKALIAFNGSLPAALFEVTILISEEDKTKADYYLNGATAFLTSHGFKNIKRDRTNNDISDVVEEKYLDRADIFVVGAHSKKGLFDFMVGSLTKYLIEVSRKPVLIGQ
jgi:nucleotide-binding universal stress UspA family protein